MKTFFTSKTLIALAVAVFAAVSSQSQTSETPASAPDSGGVLPDSIQPGSPAAEVVKLAQAGVDPGVILSYISNCPSAFKLDADKIITLNDVGVTTDMVNAMFAHDKNYLASLSDAAPPAPADPEPAAVATNSETSTAPAAPVPPAEVSVNYFYDHLAPYGSWVEIEGYGRCWRPTVVVYDSTWQPYCDRGRWVYTDCGWYWDSDYAWGATFHYGRWFNSPRYGWCWWPDTVWAPSWVTWRSSDDYCGWAPLPPFAVYQPGIGFTYRGNNVAVSFGFGLASSCYTFVSYGNFCQPHPRYYCVPRHQVEHIYNQTAACNNYNWHNHTIVNNGVSVTVIGTRSRHPIQAVPIGSLVNANRHGWHGQSIRRPARPFGTSNSNGAETHQFVRGGFQRDATPQNGNNHRENAGRHSAFGTPMQTASRHDNNSFSGRSSTPASPRDNHNQRFAGGNASRSAQPAQRVSAPASNRPDFATAPRPNQTRNDQPSARSGRQQITRSYTPPAAGAPARTPVIVTPVRSPAPNNWSPATAQRAPRINSAPREQTRQMVPQRSEPRLNIVYTAPRNITPAAPAQPPNPAANGNNSRPQGWMARNH